jgi:hypothetical protein
MLRNLDNGVTEQQTLFCNSCSDSYCPICQRKEAKKKAIKIVKFLEENKKENYYFFLTLTQPNIHYKDFKISKVLFQKTWDDFKKRYLKNNAHFNGYVYTYELTFEENRQDYIHPHSHVLLSFKRRNDKGHLQTAKSVFNVEEEIEKFRSKWTSYFLSKLSKYHAKKGNIYGIKESYNESFMNEIDNTNYLEYKKNFSVDIKTIKEEEFDKVAFEISHYMFKPTSMSKEKIVSSYDSLLEVYRYKLKMYSQIKRMRFTNSGGVFGGGMLNSANDTNYQLIGALKSRWDSNRSSYDSKYYNYESREIYGTIKELQEKKLIENKIDLSELDLKVTKSQIIRENQKIKELIKKLEDTKNKIEEKEYEERMSELIYRQFINEEQLERKDSK